MREAIRVRDSAGTIIVRNNLVGGATKTLMTLDDQNQVAESNFVATL
jgi:hypothetical protein